MKKPAVIIGILIITVLVLSIFKTFVSNRISTSGTVLGAIEEKINGYKTENALISEKLYALSSLTSISEKADKLGFIEGKSSFVLTNPVPIALKQ